MSDVLVQLPQGYADAEFAAANADLLEGDILSTYVRPLEANPEGTQMEHYLHWMEERGATVTEYSLRSEEHTSELQSLMRISYAVFCLKKKKTTNKKKQER